MYIWLQGYAYPKFRVVENKLAHAFIWASDAVNQGADIEIVLEGQSPLWLLELP